MNHFIFDVESVGLHGEGFAVGYVVVDSTGKRIEERLHACPSGNAYGTRYDHDWVNANVPELVPECHTPEVVRDMFWQDYMRWKARSDTQFWADCLWPVEARFLIACVNDDPINRMWEGPYPFHEIATLIYANDLDPLARNERLADEEPIHNPLHDARQSARILMSLLPQQPTILHDVNSFRKKPVIVKAEQFFYDKPPINGVFYPDVSEDGKTYIGDAFVVTVHDQRVYLQNGDWILPEPDGEHYYPVKDDIFKATYEAI